MKKSKSLEVNKNKTKQSDIQAKSKGVLAPEAAASTPASILVIWKQKGRIKSSFR